MDIKAVKKLFDSPLGQRMKDCKKLYREFKFSLLWDAGEIFGKAAGEQLLLQGVVDCCLEEEDGLVLIDYKTDRVRTAEEIAKRSAFYRGQLLSYAAAMERIRGKKVKQRLLYFISPGKTVEIK